MKNRDFSLLDTIISTIDGKTSSIFQAYLILLQQAYTYINSICSIFEKNMPLAYFYLILLISLLYFSS